MRRFAPSLRAAPSAAAARTPASTAAGAAASGSWSTTAFVCSAVDESTLSSTATSAPLAARSASETFSFRSRRATDLATRPGCGDASSAGTSPRSGPKSRTYTASHAVSSKSAAAASAAPSTAARVCLGGSLECSARLEASASRRPWTSRGGATGAPARTAPPPLTMTTARSARNRGLYGRPLVTTHRFASTNASGLNRRSLALRLMLTPTPGGRGGVTRSEARRAPGPLRLRREEEDV